MNTDNISINAQSSIRIAGSAAVVYFDPFQVREEAHDADLVLITHEHFDHCWGVNRLRERFPHVKLVCSSMCSVFIQDMKKNHSVFYRQPGFELKPADMELETIGWHLDFLRHDMVFYPAQGHTASGVIGRIGKFLFTGDELLKGGKTVTKLKAGSEDKLRDSMRLLESLKGQGLMVHPGHGDVFMLDEYDLNLMFF
jgi:glyoxylase-like metal-dependent hydrolase (beta-lactamase superfamily II)